jgi:hypothetical protein
MGWERRNGRCYYYRKRRVGGRVVSEYVGAGAVGESAALEDERERLKRDDSCSSSRRLLEEGGALELELRSVERAARTLASAALVAAGFRCHRGEWRRRREPDKKD